MLWALENGHDPADYTPISSVGPGAMELRATKIGPQGQDFRVVYVAKFDDHIYVLHAFEKKTLKTPHHQIAKAKARYKALVARLKQASK